MLCKECGHENPAINSTCQNCQAKLYLAKLRITLDSGRHQTHFLFPQNYKLGRGDENEIVIADPSVSRCHAEIKFENGLFFIVDSGSKNGYLLNNSHFKHQELHDLDCIQVGNVLLNFYDQTGRSVPGKLRTEEFVQEEFFKFSRNRRTEITTDAVLHTMFDLVLSLIHAEKGFLFECNQTIRPKFKFGKNTKRELVAENQLSQTDKLIIDEAIKLRDMKITFNSSDSKSVDGSGWQRIAVPLIAGKGGEFQNSEVIHEGLLGVCYFCSEEKSKPISKRKQELLNVLIHQISIAMENEMLVSEAKEEKRRISEQLLAARKIQQKLFSNANQKFETLQVATFVAPCETVGGDYFDIVAISGSKVAIAIGDICGKGLPAALLASTVQAAICSHLEYSTLPSEIIRKLNRLLIKSTADSIFLTLFFGILDLESGILEYINAGHPPPILVRRNNSIEELSATTFALGIFETETEQQKTIEKTIKFEAGDILVMYTDGVIENRNGNKKFYGRKRLLKLMQSISATGNIRRRKLETILKNIVDDLSDFSGEERQEDDLTLFAVKRK